MESLEDETQFDPPPGRRRGFLKGALAMVGGLVALLAAPVAGLRVFLQPLRQRRTEAADLGFWVRVTRLAALPEVGRPQRFSVTADRVNAWSRESKVRVGAVFLQRRDGGPPLAFNVICPHAGCLVDVDTSSKGYLCPCHNSTFALDGGINDPNSPSPRGLDPLEAEVRGDGEVWVRFQNFRPGVEERIPLA